MSKNVIVLGLVSFFNDFASEMIYPIIPLFLTGVLGAPVSIVGLVEGIAESTASLLKAVSGWYSDRIRRRKEFAVFGYTFSTFAKLMMALAQTWPIVLFARFIDRFGKGIRTSARDALIAESSTAENRGFSFGLHRAMDTAGAVIGPLSAMWLLILFNNDIRKIFFFSFFPGFAGVLLLLLFVREAKKDNAGKQAVKIAWRELDPSFKIFLLVTVVFSLGNSSDAFLILRAKGLGLSIFYTIFAYVVFNLSYSLFSLPAGMISDRVGPRKVLFIGFLVFSAIYMMFGLVNNGAFVWILFPLYGVYMAMTEGVGKAYIANLVPQERSATAFGVYQTAVGIATFFASLIAGLLWTHVSVRAPFVFGGAMALLSAVLFAGLHGKMARRP